MVFTEITFELRGIESSQGVLSTIGSDWEKEGERTPLESGTEDAYAEEARDEADDREGKMKGSATVRTGLI